MVWARGDLHGPARTPPGADTALQAGLPTAPSSPARSAPRDGARRAPRAVCPGVPRPHPAAHCPACPRPPATAAPCPVAPAPPVPRLRGPGGSADSGHVSAPAAPRRAEQRGGQTDGAIDQWRPALGPRGAEEGPGRSARLAAPGANRRPGQAGVWRSLALTKSFRAARRGDRPRARQEPIERRQTPGVVSDVPSDQSKSTALEFSFTDSPLALSAAADLARRVTDVPGGKSVPGKFRKRG